MKKHTSEEAYYARIRNLAAVNKTSLKESQNRTLGDLIDYERAADGVAYGIVKEQHQYYIKKGGLNESLNVTDFAYIGGTENITDYQYGKLSEAEKQRNMLLKTLNEDISTKFTKTGSKVAEDVAGDEIEMAASKVDALDAATAAVEDPADGGASEMDAGLAAMGGEEPAPVDDTIADGGEGMPPEGGEGMSPMDGEEGGEGMPPMDSEEDGEGMPPMDGEEGGEGGMSPEGDDSDESDATKEIEKSLGRLTNTLRKTDLTEPQVKGYVNTFLAAFKDDFPEIDIEDRKEMADKITKVVPDEDIESLGQNVEDTDGEEGIEEDTEECTDCGGFAQYAESRGFNADSIQECGEDEMTNLVSGYANEHGDGQNDDDLKALALFITPEIIEKLKSEYGHDDFADQVEPFSSEMNESSDEDRQAQISELFGGLSRLRQKGGEKIANAANQAKQAVGNKYNQAKQAVGDKVDQAKQAVGDTVDGIKQTYHTGEKNSQLGKLESIAAQLGQKIAQVNKHAEKGGEEPINIKSILSTISNQVAGKAGTANLDKFRTNEQGIPVDSVEVQPTVGSELEEDVTIKVGEKAGKKLSTTGVPVKELKEGEEDDTEGIDIDNLDVSSDNTAEEAIPDETDNGGSELTSGFQSMGGGVVKPTGAETTTVEISKGSVNVTMNESEAKLRRYIRKRLEEHAGLRKPKINENTKSKKLQKLDTMIDKQFGLFESKVKKKINKN